jgi:hypothetical protein
VLPPARRGTISGVAIPERIYRRTEAGTRAWASDRSGLPAAYRRILALIDCDTHSDVIRGAMTAYPVKQLMQWLEQLETLKFLRSAAVGSEYNLDFTDSMSLAALRARYEAA